MLLQPITVQFSKSTLKPSVYTLIVTMCLSVTVLKILAFEILGSLG